MCDLVRNGYNAVSMSCEIIVWRATDAFVDHFLKKNILYRNQEEKNLRHILGLSKIDCAK